MLEQKQGRQAAINGLSISDNIYSRSTASSLINYCNWQIGFMQEKLRLLKLKKAA